MASADISAGIALATLIGALWTVGAVVRPKVAASEQVAAGILILLGAAWLIMWQPLAGVSLVSARWGMRTILLGGLAALVLARRPQFSRPSTGPLVVGSLLAAAVASAGWTQPTDRYPGLDMPWHEGWIRQLTGGLPEPEGLYSGVPSAYPWMGHALSAAVMTTFGLGMPALLIVMSGLTALVLGVGVWLLAAQLGFDPSPRTWATLLALGGGGLGWLVAPGRHAVSAVNPSTIGAYHGDFLLAPAVTTALGDVPPPLPREFGIALIPLGLWLFVRAVSSRSWVLAAVAGGLAAAVLMIAPIAAVTLLAGMIAVSVAGRSWLGLPWLAGCVVISAVWTGPLVVHAFQLGGFTRLSQVPPISPTAAQLAVAWGVIPVLAVIGAVVAARHHTQVSARMLAAVVTALVAPAILTATLQGNVTAFPAFGRVLRYLPSATVGISLLAGLGVPAVLAAAGRYRVVALVLLCLMVFSTPVLATLGERATVARAPLVLRCDGPFPLTARQEFAVLSPSASLSSLVARGVFSRTGAETLYVRDPRIRYRHYERRTTPQTARRRLLRQLKAGAEPPAAVRAVLFDDRLGAVDSRYRPLAGCTYGVHRFTLATTGR